MTAARGGMAPWAAGISGFARAVQISETEQCSEKRAAPRGCRPFRNAPGNGAQSGEETPDRPEADPGANVTRED